jgi:hypothetical protein
LTVIALARELKPLSLLENNPKIEFAKIAALLSPKLTGLPLLGISKISYGMHVKEGTAPSISYDLIIPICLLMKLSGILPSLFLSKPTGFTVVLIFTCAFLLKPSRKFIPLSPIVL